MRKSKIRNYFTLPLLLVVFSMIGTAKLFANVKLPAVFSDNMVLQQQEKCVVWGWADPGENIVVSNSWSSATVSAKADATGKWKLLLQTPKAGGPYTITVKGNNTLELKDVLIGEVWLCSGQSNMGFSLKGDANAKTEIPQADFPSIRYFSVKRQYGPGEFDDCPGSVWERTSPSTAPGFSAVAYYFAKKIQQELHVPVGIIYSAWGGTPAEAWTPSAALKSDTLLYRYINRWKDMYVTVGKDSVAYRQALDNWEQERKKGDSTKLKKPEEPATLVWYNRPWREPSVLFNGMINPVIPFSIKGVLWYQGESNVSFADEYYRLFSSLINNWRARWNKANNLPFYFVQIAPFGYSNMDAAARLRNAQYEVMQNIPHTGMAVTIDLGNMKDIHFTHKREVGDRLAFIALAKDYDHKNVLYKGPECNKATVNDQKVVLDFGPGELTYKGNELKGFEIGYQLPGTDSLVFTTAKATMEGNKIIVSGTQAKQPKAIRYAWLLAGEANLFNKDGLPAFPFIKELK